jgi:hypothetical protein
LLLVAFVNTKLLQTLLTRQPLSPTPSSRLLGLIRKYNRPGQHIPDPDR